MLKPDYVDEKSFGKICETCFTKAELIIKRKMKPACDMDIFDLTDLLIALELEKIEKDILSDSNIDYNDEILSIEYVGDKETIDITVTGDNLFYCNNILTKNSIGLPATVDAMFALISTEELEAMGQLMIKQLKNRWGDLSYYRRFVVGIDRSKMKLYNLEDGAQKNVKSEIVPDKPSFDKSSFGESLNKRAKKKFEVEDIQ
jgi:hypothetical protein